VPKGAPAKGKRQLSPAQGVLKRDAADPAQEAPASAEALPRTCRDPR
jgi:hypothetical protein